MKNTIYRLFTLLFLTGVLTVSSAYAQRGHSRGGAHFGGGVRVMPAPHFSASAGMYRRGFYHRPVHYYRPYYRPYYRFYGPPIGFRLGVLPYGFLTFNTAFGPYFYYDGTFYRTYKNDQYQVVDPPMGVVVPALPKDAKTVEIDGNTYYEKNGTIYQEVLKDKETRYAVVGKNGQLETSDAATQEDQENVPDNNTTTPDQQVITQLPEGSRSVEINGVQYYVSPDGMYYQPVANPDNSLGYKIVGKMQAEN